jgi:transcriptional regulator with XRE-family HTH domain
LDTVDFSSDELKTLHKQIGNNVATIRKNSGVTQLDLSLSIGYNSTSVIAKAEAGTENRHFSIEQIYKIAVALNVDISEIFTGIKTKN